MPTSIASSVLKRSMSETQIFELNINGLKVQFSNTTQLFSPQEVPAKGCCLCHCYIESKFIPCDKPQALRDCVKEGLIWDSAPVHIAEQVLNWLREDNENNPEGTVVILALIDGGLTSIIQACDIIMNKFKPIKDHVRGLYLERKVALFKEAMEKGGVLSTIKVSHEELKFLLKTHLKKSIEK
eukprot:Pgem_evm3s6027